MVSQCTKYEVCRFTRYEAVDGSPSAIAVLLVPFWYRLTRIVPDKQPFNGCVCVLLKLGHVV